MQTLAEKKKQGIASRDFFPPAVQPAGEVTNLVKPSTGLRSPAQRAKPQPPRDEDEYAAVSSAAVLRRLADEYAAM